MGIPGKEMRYNPMRVALIPPFRATTSLASTLSGALSPVFREITYLRRIRRQTSAFQRMRRRKIRLARAVGIASEVIGTAFGIISGPVKIVPVSFP